MSGKRVDDPPTVPPPFDLAEFARESDSRVRVADPGLDPASARPTMPPPPSDSSVVDARRSEVPDLAMAPEDLEWFELSPPRRALVQQVNGKDTVDTIATHLRRPPADILSDLDALMREGVVTWR